MRVQQLWHWLYVRGATGFAEMTSVSKELRATLDSISRWRGPRWSPSRSRSTARANGCSGCRASAGERPHEVECVYIPEADRGTLCVSSQVGCTLTCSFCHTGTQRLVRNLTRRRDRRPGMVARDRLGDCLGAERAQGEGACRRGRAPRLQHRDDGHGRAALQFRGGARRAADRRRRRRRHRHLQAPHHAVDLRRGAE